MQNFIKSPESRKMVVSVCMPLLGLDDIISVLQQNWLRWYGHVLQKEDSGCYRNVWSLKWRVTCQEVDHRRLGQRLCKKTVKQVN